MTSLVGSQSEQHARAETAVTLERTYRGHFHYLLVTLDVVAISISWVSAYYLRATLDPYFLRRINPPLPYFLVLPAIAALWITVCATFQLHRRKRQITRFEEFHSLIKAVLLNLLVVLAVAYVFREFGLGRSVIFLSAGFNFPLLGLSRYIFTRLEGRQRAKGKWTVNALILGAGSTGIRALQRLEDHPEVGYRVVGFLDDDPEKAGREFGGIRVLGPLEELARITGELNVQEIFVAIPSKQPREILNLVAGLDGVPVNFRVVSNLFEVLSRGTDIDVIENCPVFDLRANGGRHSVYPAAKRLFDFALSLLLLVLTLPLLAVAALLVRLDSRGPAIFKQRRVGFRGKEFEMFKFRTMRLDTDTYEEAPSRPDDPRTTRVGRFLRRTSLDELPQFLNVLRGEMSLVGPRPEMPFIVSHYEEWQKKRFNVKPGITGLWQVIGRKELPLHENLEYDFYYIRNRSFFMDLAILLKTLPAVFKRRGAF
jgi:exopolysaccharide biosynthesis polyprenyl glycosylphosphotransferase